MDLPAQSLSGGLGRCMGWSPTMAKFTFRFQTVLKHRQRIEQDCQRELARLLRLRMILLDQLRQMQQGIRQSKQELAGSLLGRVDLDQITQFARYSSQLSYRAQEFLLRLAGVEKEIEAARQRLIKATAARKALELLRDRHLAQWQQDQDRREIAELDELAARPFLSAAQEPSR